MTNAPAIPRDGRLLSLILASHGIEDTDDRVIQQLLDFSHRYVADVLQSAQTLADHAARSKVEREDVELAIQLRKRHEFQEAPPRDYLASLAHELNILPLPPIQETFDLIRLPPAHQRLSEVNFDIIPNKSVVFEEDEAESDEASEEEDIEDGGADADGHADKDADGDDDEDMEEVVAPREVDEDYDD